MSKTGTLIHTAYKSLLERGRLSTNANQSALVDRLATLQNTLAKSSSDQNGVYIHGAVGTGKSRIADLFANTMPPSVSNRRVHFNEFMMEVHVRLHRARLSPTFAGDPLVAIGNQIRQESRVLCFDEFQVTDIADAMILKRLFGAIWGAGGVVVATSNRHPTGLYEKGLNRSLFLPFIDELQRKCQVWQLEADRDYRMTTGSGEHERLQVFFTGEKEFQRLLEISTKGVELGPMAIPVMMNRTLHVQGARIDNQRIVHTTFKSLCEANLGSSDYHALCRNANTIYLSGLRQFRADELDFVRRFITLIDLAYESKTRIVCLSTVPLFQVFSNIASMPGNLSEEVIHKAIEDMNVRKGGGSSSSMMSTFIGETEWSATGLERASLARGGAGETDVRFAIGRAVSRLFEMGSKAYGVRD